MHQTVANVLQTALAIVHPANIGQVNQIVENTLATAIHATRCSVSRSLGTSPGNFVFCRDMFIDLPLMADLVEIQQRRQLRIDENLLRQNAERREHRYQAGQNNSVQVGSSCTWSLFPLLLRTLTEPLILLGLLT